MMHSALNKLVIIGVGLIGGSFALALRKANMVKQIIGVGRSPANMQKAVDQGVIDESTNDLASALNKADAVLLAIPVGQTLRIMSDIAPHLQPDTVITDAGSTKQDVIAAARLYLGHSLAHFVPAHPIAGAEKSGISAAKIDLFRNKHLVLTPITETNHDAIERVKVLWQACGANVTRMSADEHDQILAATSHLPHILAFALMNHLSQNTASNPDHLLRFAGSGFQDFTRIASSSPEMWRDICIANRDALNIQIEAYQQELALFKEMLKENNTKGLEEAFSHAQTTRDNWLKSKAEKQNKKER